MNKKTTPKKPTITLENIFKKIDIKKLQNYKNEHFFIYLYDEDSKFISSKKIASGNNESIEIDTAKLFRYCFEKKAYYFFCVHNHPSGNPKASKADIETTTALRRLGVQIDFILLDHIIIGQLSIYSMRKKEILCIKTIKELIEKKGKK